MKNFRFLFLFYTLVALVSLVTDFDVGTSVTRSALDWAVAGGSVLGSLLGGLFGSSSQGSANEANLQIARENREWQSGENEMNRQWQEKMWNAQNVYNTPSAMRARLEEAGYNPYDMFSGGSLQAAGSAGSPSMVGAPNAPLMLPVNPMTGISHLGESISLGLQAKSVDANAANQSAQAQATILKAVADAYKDLGKDGFKAVVDRLAPYMQSVNPDSSWWTQQMKSQIYNLDMQSIKTELETSLSKRFTPEQIQTSISEANYRISEIVGRLNSMRISNDAVIQRVANETVVAAAEAFKLHKEGQKYYADAQTVDALRQFIVKSAEYNSLQDLFGAASSGQSFLMSQPRVSYWTSEEGKKASYQEERITGEQRSSDLIRALDKVMGDYINVYKGSNYVEGDYRGLHDYVPHNSKSATFDTSTPWGSKQKNIWTRYE